MTEPRTHRRIVRNRKKTTVPLSKLRTSDAVRTVVDHPRRLQELLRILEDKDRGIRGKAAAALARLSESHPGRLHRVVLRLRDGLSDESAYVRWHLVYVFGKIAAIRPAQCRALLNDLASRLDDENRIVRSVACKALSQIAALKPLVIQEFFQALKREIPPTVGRVLHSAKSRSAK